jgi:DNA-binding transcriptional LysR family regulator
MNIHYLELFYYVAKFGGISEAVRNIPYGIQQPAVSGQVIQLEEFLGVTLFQRRPFALTPAGEELYQFIKPFFDNLGPMGDKLRGGVAHHIRIGASEPVLRDHLPGILQTVQKKFPKLRVTLREAYQPDLISMLQKLELEMAVTLIEGRPATGVHSMPLLKLPLVLLVEKSCRIRSAQDLWDRDRISEPLICLPPNEAITRTFQQGLSKLGIDWFPSIEVSSLTLIETYVGIGNGIGVSVQVPKAKLPPHLRMIPLDGFPPVSLGVLWQGRATPIMQAFLDEMKKRADFLGAESQIPEPAAKPAKTAAPAAPRITPA